MKAIHNTRRLSGLLTLALSALVVLMFQGCTDLTEEPYSAVTPDKFYQTEGEVIAAVAPVYAQLRSASTGSTFEVAEISSDEAIIPTRGSDWYDNGVPLSMDWHTWSSQTPWLNNAWNDNYTGIARANAVLDILNRSEVPNKDQLIAELRALRAYYYYNLLDLFGRVPLVGDDEYFVDSANPPSNANRKTVFDFVEKELIEARENLPASWPSASYGRMTKGAADAILASLYLNAEVFSGEVTAGGLQKGQAQWQKAYDVADRVIKSGVYQLETDWNKLFAYDNSANKEHILAGTFLPVEGLGHSFIYRSLHYSQYNPSPWNGWATTEETFNKFDAADKRRNMFLWGPQVNVENGQPVTNRQGEPLVFTATIANVRNATEGEGIRFYKYPRDPQHQGYNNGNDVPIFRLAEMYLIKAEAANELGRTGEAVDLINQIRARAFDPDKPIAAGSQAEVRQAILTERLYEFCFEGKRRQDLIRMGKFNDAWQYKDASAPYRIVFPIPQNQLDANKNLTQNPGY